MNNSLMNNSLMNTSISLCLLLAGVSWISLVRADGLAIDRIYDPYVQPLEREFDYQLRYDNDEDIQIHSLGYGQALSDRWFVEMSLVGEKSPDHHWDLEGVEWEARWQLTEQGEYASDWGMQFELEREIENNGWEARSTLIVLHQWDRWVGTANAALINEWGSGIEDEIETSLAGQIKYRYSREFEPGLELFVAQETHALGPVSMGSVRLQGRQSLFWQAALLAGLDNDTPDVTARLNLEYEF